MDEDLLAPAVGAGWAGVFEGARVVAGSPTWHLSTDQVVELLRAQVIAFARLEAGRLALIRDLDDRGWAGEVGATSTAAWLSQALLGDRRAAAADVRAARALDPDGDVPAAPGSVLARAVPDPDTPVIAATGRALAAGAVSRGHADAVGRAITDLPRCTDPDARAGLHTRAEAFLLGQCQERTPMEVRGMGRYLLSVVDPEGVFAEDRGHGGRDEAGLVVDHTGRGVFRASLNPVDTALLCTLLDAGSTPRPATVDGLDRRTPGQRRAGAFTDLIRLAAGAGPTTSGALPTTLVITTTLESLVTGTPRWPRPPNAGTGSTPARSGLWRVTRASSPPSWVRRPNRWTSAGPPAPSRPASGGPWCYATGTARSQAATAHHGGATPTTSPTGPTAAPRPCRTWCCLCGHHHHGVVHAKGWTIHLNHDDRPLFTPPTWLDPTRRPRGPTRI